MEVTFCDSRERPILDQIKQALEEANKAWIASAFVTEAGLDLLLPDLETFAGKPRHQLTIISGDYLGYTSPEARESLEEFAGRLNRGRSKHVAIGWVEQGNMGPFHAKVYLFTGGGKSTLIVGSGNVTTGGMVEGIEAYIKLCGSTRVAVFGDAQDFLEGLAGKQPPPPGPKEEHNEEQFRKFVGAIWPIVRDKGVASADAYLRVVEFARSTALDAVHQRLLVAARAGYIVEIAAHHGGLWVPLAPDVFNAGRRTDTQGKITWTQQTSIGYELFGEQETKPLRDIERGLRYGRRDFGWETHWGFFVPSGCWAEFSQWFGAQKAKHEQTGKAIMGPPRSWRKRALAGLPTQCREIWRTHNPGKPVPRALSKEVAGRVEARLEALTDGRHRPWRFEARRLPHPVVLWATSLPGVADCPDLNLDDELADFGVNAAEWMLRRLAGTSNAHPAEAARKARQVAAANSGGLELPAANRMSRALARAAEARQAGETSVDEWHQQRDVAGLEAGKLLGQLRGERERQEVAPLLNWLSTQLPEAPELPYDSGT